MTDERLDELRRLCEAATPGPWRNGADPSHFDAPEVTDDKTFSYWVTADRDAAFIAAARTAVPELLAECERMRTEVELLRITVQAEATLTTQQLDIINEMRPIVEAAEPLEQRDKLLAEIGSLRAMYEQAKRDHASYEAALDSVKDKYDACRDERDHIWPLWKLRYEISYKLGFLVRDYPGDKQAASLLAAIDAALSASGEKEQG